MKLYVNLENVEALKQMLRAKMERQFNLWNSIAPRPPRPELSSPSGMPNQVLGELFEIVESRACARVATYVHDTEYYLRDYPGSHRRWGAALGLKTPSNTNGTAVPCVMMVSDEVLTEWELP